MRTRETVLDEIFERDYAGNDYSYYPRQCILDAMQTFAREACNEYIDYWNNYEPSGENHLSFDEWIEKQINQEEKK